MIEPNEIIHQSMRLRIMAALTTPNCGEPLEFIRLQRLIGATAGNLGAHLDTLEKAGYIAIEKDFVGRRPRTRVRITRTGRHAFERHVAYLRDILELAPGERERPDPG